MIIFFQEIGLLIFLWFLQLIDGIMELFSAISGVATVNYHGQQVNILETIIADPVIASIFWCILILAVGLACIFAIVGIIKNILSGSRNISSIVGKFLLAILGTFAMLAAVFLGIMIAGSGLPLIAHIFQIGNTTKLSNALFNACVGDWLDGHSIQNIDITSLRVRDIFGDYNTAFFGVFPKDWKMNGMVNPETFMYLPALIVGIAVSISLLIALVNLAKRIFEIVILYLAMPISMSTLPLDDGARFKNWRELFVSKVILAFGAVFSVNVFALILPFVTQMKIDGLGNFGNAMFLIVMIIGGAMVIPAGLSLFVRLFGQADDMHAGGGFLRSAFYGSRFVGGFALGLATKGIGGVYHAGRVIHAHHVKADEKAKREAERKAEAEAEDDKYIDMGSTGGTTT